jgi:hypothetical protein
MAKNPEEDENRTNRTVSQPLASDSASRKKVNGEPQATRRAAKKACRTQQASLSNRAALDHVKTMFERQAQLWKQHADAINKASSNETGIIAQQQPWLGLSNSRLFAGDSDSTSAAVEQLTRAFTSVQNRTYTRQATPGNNQDTYEPSSEDDESDE